MIELDTTGLLCPMPVLKLQQLMVTAKVGDKIKLIATDIGVKHDVPAWCNVHQHQLVSMEAENNRIYIVVQKA